MRRESGVRVAALLAAAGLIGGLVGGVALSGRAGKPRETARMARAEREREERDERTAPAARLAGRYADGAGQVRQDLWRAGVAQLLQMRAAGRSRNRALPWRQIGPAPLRIDPDRSGQSTTYYMGQGPVAGEVVGIAIDPRGTQDQTLYIAAGSGGVWKSVDGGESWQPKTDELPSQSIGCVTLDPNDPDVVYAGTGNAFDPGGQRVDGNHFVGFFKGVGIYRSADGGDTWSILGGEQFSAMGIWRIVIPAPNVLLVAARAPGRHGRRAGIYRSADGGRHFGSNAPKFDNGMPILAGQPSELALDTAAAGVVYAAIEGQGIFKSTNGGASFRTNLFRNVRGLKGQYGFIAFAQSTEPDNRTLYASVAGPPYFPYYFLAEQFRGLFKSTDGGAHWVHLKPGADSAAQIGAGIYAFAQTVGVDPHDANRVYAGFPVIFISTDGGVHFAEPSPSLDTVHYDQHVITFSPRSHAPAAPAPIWIGTDGGLSMSADGGDQWRNLNEGVATLLFAAIAMGQDDPAYTYGGAQDCGTSAHGPEHGGTDWHLGAGGDGGTVAVDPADARTCYGAINGSYFRTTDGGFTWPSLENAPKGSQSMHPVVVDPNSSSRVYLAGPASRLCRSEDRAESFQPVHTFPAVISDIVVAPGDSNRVWVGLMNGQVWRTVNASAGKQARWVEVSPEKREAFTSIAVLPADPNVVCAVFAGFSGAKPPQLSRHVFLSTDNGAHWRDIGGTRRHPLGSVPDLPVHDVVFDPSVSPPGIIIATDAGVLASYNLGVTWEALGSGLPVVPCWSLAINTRVNPPILRVGTYGRSAWELSRIEGPQLSVQPSLVNLGEVTVGSSRAATVTLRNVGREPLHVQGIARVAGSAQLQLEDGGLPATIAPGGKLDVRFRFAPSGDPGLRTATFLVESDAANAGAGVIEVRGRGLAVEPFTLLSFRFYLTANPVTEGDVASGAILDAELIYSGPAPEDTVVSFTSDVPEVLAAPEPVTIRKGRSTASLQLRVGSVEAPVTVHLTAQPSIGPSRSITLHVKP